jgi:hypothetical protein
MKKFTFFILFSALVSLSFAQIQRNKVVVELFTGTWCVFCPGASLGADDLVLNGHDVAIVEHHYSDPFQTDESFARDGYYGVTGYPTQVFDGTDQSSGGHASVSIYPSYIPKYNAAMSVLTPIDIDLSWEYDTATSNFTVTGIADLVATLPANEAPVMHMVVVESHVPYNWFGMNECNFINRLMLPDANGTPLDFSTSTKDTIEYTFSLNPSWVRNNCEVVLFMQDPASKKVYNGAMESLEGPTVTLDANAMGFATPVDPVRCANEALEPQVILQNRGSATLTSVSMIYSVNNQSAQLYNWTGSLAFNEEDTVTLPAANFMPLETNNMLQVVLANPNGAPDQNGANDLISAFFDAPSFNNGIYQLLLLPDDYGSQISWVMRDEDEDMILASGGPYQDGNKSLIIAQVPFGTHEGCYSFEIMDSGGDGLTSSGNAYYKFMAPGGSVVIESTDGDYGSGEKASFTINYNTAIDLLEEGVISVFPNPSTGRFAIEMPELTGQLVSLEVYQINGTLIQQLQTQTGAQALDLSAQPAGVYLLKARTEEGIFTTKLFKQ